MRDSDFVFRTSNTYSQVKVKHVCTIKVKSESKRCQTSQRQSLVKKHTTPQSCHSMLPNSQNNYPMGQRNYKSSTHELKKTTLYCSSEQEDNSE